MRERGLGLLLLALGELARVENEPIKCIIGSALGRGFCGCIVRQQIKGAQLDGKQDQAAGS